MSSSVIAVHPGLCFSFPEGQGGEKGKALQLQFSSAFHSLPSRLHSSRPTFPDLYHSYLTPHTVESEPL